GSAGRPPAPRACALHPPGRAAPAAGRAPPSPRAACPSRGRRSGSPVASVAEADPGPGLAARAGASQGFAEGGTLHRLRGERGGGGETALPLEEEGQAV